MYIIYTDRHHCHAPAEELTRGGFMPYSDSPQRIENILQALKTTSFAQFTGPQPYSQDAIYAVHDAAYLDFLAQAEQADTPPGGLIPTTFAQGHRARKPRTPHQQMGYYCFDTATTIVPGTYAASRNAANIALTGADLLTQGQNVVYALCRPPGHHAHADLCGGYCFLNNAAIAASHLSRWGRIAILDIDYHHGNGTQDIFYTSNQILTVSIHADPARQYPLYWGYADEQGEAEGRGYNHNFPQPAGITDNEYLHIMEEALSPILHFAPEYLIICLGLDIYVEDPWGDFAISLDGFSEIGARLAGLEIPTLIIQEGGYNLDALGTAVVNFLSPFESNTPAVV